MRNQMSLFEGMRLRLKDSIELSLVSLTEYGQRYRHWAVAYSGGKDSSATVTFIAYAIREGLVPRPESLTVLYADTRQELPVLAQTARGLLDHLKEDGFNAQMVLPAIENRFYVYMLGYGVPPPSNRFRWCTAELKIEPMMYALEDLRNRAEEKLLMLTGVRLGESAVRDQRIALSCSTKGECGQGMFHDPKIEGEKTAGWFQPAPRDAISDTLAPLIHWRVCHVFDWLYLETKRHQYPEVINIAEVYGDEDVRTGCVGCPLASRDVALERLIRKPQWAGLTPLLELKRIFRELKRARNRLRKSEPDRRKDGKLARNGQRMGPLTLTPREWGLERVLDIQARAGIDLINGDEERRIREMWAEGAWPQKWTGDEIRADVPLDQITVLKNGLDIVVQPLLVR